MPHGSGTRADDGLRPSFARSIGEAEARKEHPAARRMFDKVEARRQLEELAAPLVPCFELIGPLDRLHPSMLRTPTVIKPRRGYSDRGVLALQPLGGGRWRELLRERDLDFEGIRGQLATALLTLNLPDAWIIEDLFPGDPPGTAVDDVKLCLFDDELACSFVRSNGPRGYQWFDARWQPVDTGLHSMKLNPRIAAPPLRDELTEAARAIARQLRLPFIRVDFLANRTGFVIGELTPYPGWYRDFTPEWDMILGMHYERAESALLARSAAESDGERA